MSMNAAVTEQADSLFANPAAHIKHSPVCIVVAVVYNNRHLSPQYGTINRQLHLFAIHIRLVMNV